MTDLRDWIAAMVSMEESALARVSAAADGVNGDPRVESALRRCQRAAEDHLRALPARLSSLGGRAAGPPSQVAVLPTLPDPDSAALGRSSGILIQLSSRLTHLATGYAVLHAVVHRFYDSVGEGNTADLAENHLRAYAGAAQQINQLVSDVVVSELDSEGQQCRYGCPACAVDMPVRPRTEPRRSWRPGVRRCRPPLAGVSGFGGPRRAPAPTGRDWQLVTGWSRLRVENCGPTWTDRFSRPRSAIISQVI